MSHSHHPHHEFTFGEKAVGLDVGTPGDPAAEALKKTFAGIIDSLPDFGGAAYMPIMEAHRAALAEVGWLL